MNKHVLLPVHGSILYLAPIISLRPVRAIAITGRGAGVPGSQISMTLISTLFIPNGVSIQGT